MEIVFPNVGVPVGGAHLAPTVPEKLGTVEIVLAEKRREIQAPSIITAPNAVVMFPACQEKWTEVKGKNNADRGCNKKTSTAICSPGKHYKATSAGFKRIDGTTLPQTPKSPVKQHNAIAKASSYVSQTSTSPGNKQGNTGGACKNVGDTSVEKVKNSALGTAAKVP